MSVLLRRAAALLVVAAVCADGASTFYSSDPNLGSARVVFQTNFGDIEFGFFPHVAPKTVEHIFKLVRLGCYNTNHFFRVDKGFVAQVADVMSGRTAPMNEEQKKEAEKTIVGEFSSVKHVRGILSMGRHSDPDSAGSSFSILLGNSPHLDGQVFNTTSKLFMINIWPRSNPWMMPCHPIKIRFFLQTVSLALSLMLGWRSCCSWASTTTSWCASSPPARPWSAPSPP